MNSEKLNELEIAPDAKRRPQHPLREIFIGNVAVYFTQPRARTI